MLCYHTRRFTKTDGRVQCPLGVYTGEQVCLEKFRVFPDDVHQRSVERQVHGKISDGIVIGLIFRVYLRFTSCRASQSTAIPLAENGRSSIGKRSRHLDIRNFFMTDLINRKQVSVKFCHTDGMVADYMTKPLTGRKFQQYRSIPVRVYRTVLENLQMQAQILKSQVRNTGIRASQPSVLNTVSPGELESRCIYGEGRGKCERRLLRERSNERDAKSAIALRVEM
jgi:hypothetical protein